MSLELETAAHRETLRRVAIDPVSRVEGHGKVTLLLDEAGHVREARLHIVEFRGFEAFIEGRPYWEVPVMVQRLCGICPVSHHLAAAKALDGIAGGAPIPPVAEKLRRLMHYGQIMQSHALHFYHLASPDLLFGFEAPPATRNIAGLAAAYPHVARQGVMLRRFGQEIIQATSGKRIHGTGAIPGGMNRHLSPEDQARLRPQADHAVSWSQEAVTLAAHLSCSQPLLYREFGQVRSPLLSLVRDDGALDFYTGQLRLRDASGHILHEGLDPARYPEYLEEEVKPWSYMKFPYFSDLGPQRGWYKVGPLARVQNCDFIPSPLAEHARQAFMTQGDGELQHGALAYHWARMIEMLHAAEVVRELLDDPDLLEGEILRQGGPRQREGISAIEAPRGTLIHHYRVGEDDLVSHCNLIVSTTHNNQAMNESIRQVALRHLDGRSLTEGLLNHIEVAIRAFDPCLSCATHALGQMPLVVELQDGEGTLLDRQLRG